MKRWATNLRVIIPLAVLIFVIILSQSILEYRASRRAAVDLLSNQANSLIYSVSAAAEKGLFAYESQQGRITDHLYSIGEMVGRLYAVRQLSAAVLDDILRSNRLTILQLVDETCMPVMTATSLGPDIQDIRITAIKCENFDPEKPHSFAGFVNLSENVRQGEQVRVFAAVTILSDNSAIIAGIDADELLNLRRAFGAGSTIEALAQSPGVRYVAIISDPATDSPDEGGVEILAASRGFQSSLDDKWYGQTPRDTAITTRIRDVSGDREVPGDASRGVFEVLAPFSAMGDQSSQILIGLKTEYLDLISSKLRSDIIWRSALFLFVAILAISGVIIRQNYGMLSRQYGIIQEDVRRLEADRALTAKLAAMGELASGVAHEIRNPLNAISVIIQRLKREFEPKKDHAEYRELTDVIQKETDRIDKSVKQFLTLARPPVLNKSISDINDCVRQAAALYEPCASRKNCQLHITTGDIPNLNIDKELCKQAIVNLFDNALSAVDHDGHITVTTYRKGKTLYLDVADNGSGIPDDKKERIFDLYYTTKPTGTGIGLPTVLRIVKEHGGRVEVLDNPGGGALFRLELPLE
jgi:signal transduction histidine kinase